MNTNKQAAGRDTKVKLSMLWIFVLLNMFYADMLSLMDPSSAIRTRMVGTPMSPELLLVGAIVMETAIIMVILSRLLPDTANRWANSIAVVICSRTTASDFGLKKEGQRCLT